MSVKILTNAKIVGSYPPNIDAIKEVFPLKGREIFAYDQVIYNPGGGELTDSLIAHENVHFKQQALTSPDEWWERFILDGPFRFEQELEAHRMEFRVACLGVRDRNDINAIHAHIAQKLASPLYGQMIGYRKAMSLLR